MSISQDPERECPECGGRMYWDDFDAEVPHWICMNCKHEIYDD